MNPRPFLALAAFATCAFAAQAAEVADPRICQPMPGPEAYAPAAVQRQLERDKLSSADANMRAAIELSTRNAFMDVCIHRWAYLLAKDNPDLRAVAGAAVAKCDSLQGYSSFVGRTGGARQVHLMLDALAEGARNRVIEARAGKCWAMR